MRTFRRTAIALALSTILSTPTYATYGGNDPENDIDMQQDQHQGQDQSQEQSNTQGQEQTSSVTNTQEFDTRTNSNANVFNNSRTRVNASGASSGRSTSTCQKVRDLRGADGWLFGIRWDVTDKECRRLNVSDTEYERGNTYFANTLTCSVRSIYSAFGGAEECKAAFNLDGEILSLRERNEELEMRLIAQEQKCDKQINKCLSTVNK